MKQHKQERTIQLLMIAWVAALLCICAPTLHAQQTSEPQKKSEAIDLLKLVSMYLIPSSANYNVQAWHIGSEAGSPIRWITDGIKWDKGESAYIRKGSALVMVSGKPIHILRKNWEPLFWGIAVIGPHAGITRVDISSGIASQELTLDLETELKKSNIEFHLYKCDEIGEASMGEKLYEIKAPGKKTAWLYYVWSCGSGGCSAELKVFLFKKDTELIPDMTTSCSGTK